MSSPRVSPTSPGARRDRDQRARDVRLGRPARVVADRQALVGQAEHDLGRHDEAREAHRVDLGAGDGRRRAPPRAVEVVDRVAELGRADLAEALGELARRARTGRRAWSRSRSR